jgi:hypothetical protein
MTRKTLIALAAAAAITVGFAASAEAKTNVNIDFGINLGGAGLYDNGYGDGYGYGGYDGYDGYGGGYRPRRHHYYDAGYNDDCGFRIVKRRHWNWNHTHKIVTFKKQWVCY